MKKGVGGLIPLNFNLIKSTFDKLMLLIFIAMEFNFNPFPKTRTVKSF